MMSILMIPSPTIHRYTAQNLRNAISGPIPMLPPTIEVHVESRTQVTAILFMPMLPPKHCIPTRNPESRNPYRLCPYQPKYLPYAKPSYPATPSSSSYPQYTLTILHPRPDPRYSIPYRPYPPAPPAAAAAAVPGPMPKLMARWLRWWKEEMDWKPL